MSCFQNFTRFCCVNCINPINVIKIVRLNAEVPFLSKSRSEADYQGNENRHLFQFLFRVQTCGSKMFCSP